MTPNDIRFINCFQATLVTPVYNDLSKRKHRNWKNDLFAINLENILCTLSILPKGDGAFDLTYMCDRYRISASYIPGKETEHIEHCLCELYRCFELYSYKNTLLPCQDEIKHLYDGIKKLLRIINPEKYKSLN